MRKTTTAPSVLALSLADAKAHLRIDATDEDTTITSYIKSAILDAESETRRHFVNRTRTRKLNGFYCRHCIRSGFWGYCPQIIYLDADLVSVTSVVYVDSDGNTQTLDSSAYQVVTSHPVGYVMPAYGTSFPAARWQPESVTVTYICGMSSTDTGVDERARDMVRLLTAHKYRNREAVLVGTISKITDLAVMHIADQLRAPLIEEDHGKCR